MSRSAAIALALLTVLSCRFGPAAKAEQAAIPEGKAKASLRADGTRFALTLPDGRVLYSTDLVGSSLRMHDGRQVRIDGVESVKDLHGKTIWQHTLSTPDEHGVWNNYCLAHPDGSRFAMLVPGRERSDGTIEAAADSFALTCTAGAQGKCLRFGYRPWEAPVNGLDQRAAYNACIRMVRADYGGEGISYTENGMKIDVFDDAGIQTADMLAEQEFEAGWTAAGPVCVHHVRVARKAALGELEQRHPKLRARVGTVCTLEFARAHGAIVFNRSDSRGDPPTAATALSPARLASEKPADR